jgi:hypothetical protein
VIRPSGGRKYGHCLQACLEEKTLTTFAEDYTLEQKMLLKQRKKETTPALPPLNPTVPDPNRQQGTP